METSSAGGGVVLQPERDREPARAREKATVLSMAIIHWRNPVLARISYLKFNAFAGMWAIE
ncbi:MAG: hypothetical protein LBV12_10730 [Puniceicoccales bacterium]|jgi:hypothetical protein|nr:hypothetical protein [Puniceicoccales bacterium]